MSVLLRAAELVRRPVVTLAGDDIAQIKDVIYSSETGELAGFTLNGRGFLSGPLRKTLPWANVHGLGPDAVMIESEASLAGRTALRGEPEGAGGGVLGSRVITDRGRELGVVTDLILAVGQGATDAVGYEIIPADDAAPRRQFVPLPDTLAVSGEALIVPESATGFIRDDLAGFGAAVDEFRERLRAGTIAGYDDELEEEPAEAEVEPVAEEKVEEPEPEPEPVAEEKVEEPVTEAKPEPADEEPEPEAKAEEPEQEQEPEPELEPEPDLKAAAKAKRSPFKRKPTTTTPPVPDARTGGSAPSVDPAAAASAKEARR